MPGKTIVIAEDNTIDSKILSSVLTARGYQVITAFDGKAALEILRNQEVDLLITDIMMPGYTGIELLWHAREEKRLPPTLVLTSDKTDETVLATLSGGARDHLKKPVNVPILLAKVAQLLQS
ncbi:MAG: response regulator [Proteobacteria bacterium]|nr:MAG: response regulator [Pseudomonadota bacterium]